MRDVFLGKRRGEWVAYLRRVEARSAAKREGGSDYDDGMSHGIIPFGAVHQWKRDADRRLSEALAHPLPARVVGWDTTAVGLAVTCPWCGVEHRHLVTEDWDPETPLEAGCGKGFYRLAVGTHAASHKVY